MRWPGSEPLNCTPASGTLTLCPSTLVFLGGFSWLLPGLAAWLRFALPNFPVFLPASPPLLQEAT